MKMVKGLNARELIATLFVLAASGVLPNAYVVSGMKLTTLSHLVGVAIVPAIAVIVAASIYASVTGLKPLARTIAITSVAGVLATAGLDVIRLPSTWAGYLPMDEGKEIGMMLNGEMMEDQGAAHSGGPEPTGHGAMTERASFSTVVRGYIYHYGNGISFALVFALLFGGAPWWAGVLYAVFFVDAGMMVAMPAMGMPLRASGWVAALLAHVGYGVVLGVLLSRWLNAPGLVFRLRPPRAGSVAERLPS